jgi:hypothetical protein
MSISRNAMVVQKKIEGKMVCDPNGSQFEPLLAHFEQLRLVYETQQEEDCNV